MESEGNSVLLLAIPIELQEAIAKTSDAKQCGAPVSDWQLAFGARDVQSRSDEDVPQAAEEQPGERGRAREVWQSQLKETPDNPVLLNTVRRLAP